MRRRMPLSSVFSLLLSFVIASCASVPSAGEKSTTPTGPFEVAAAVSGEPVTLDSHQNLTGGNAQIAPGAIYDTLVAQTDPTEGPGPGLAESWTFAPDGMSVTMKLRQGVMFHDGTAFDADAVKFNYERQMDSNNEFYKLGTFRSAGLLNLKLPVELLDQYTVRFNFKALQVPDINLTYFFQGSASMESPTAIRKYRDTYGVHPVGTGPFKLVEWTKGQRIVLEKNQDYWGAKPQIDRLTLVTMADPDARLAALRSGAVDINNDISGDQLDVVLKDQGNTGIASKATRADWHVLLNEKLVPELKDKRVRMALNYAIDKTAIVHDINRDTFVASTGPISPGFGEWFNKDLPGFPFSQTKAKQLLADAGFPDGKGFPELTMKVPTDVLLSGKPVAMAEAIQANLSQVGIKIKIETMLKATWDQQVTTLDAKWQLAAFPLGGSNVDPDNYMAGYHSSRLPPNFHNWGYYRNEEYETLYPQSQKEPDHAKRVQMIWRLQAIAGYEDPAEIWIGHPKVSIAFAKNKVGNLVILTAAPRFSLIKRP